MIFAAKYHESAHPGEGKSHNKQLAIQKLMFEQRNGQSSSPLSIMSQHFFFRCELFSPLHEKSGKCSH